MRNKKKLDPLTDGRFGPRPLTLRGRPPKRWDRLGKNSSPTPQQIRRARLHFRLTQQQAAGLIDYTLNGWQRFEQGERTCRPTLWQAWLAAARASLRSLF